VSRISERFQALKAKGQTGLVTYITAGDPDLERTAGIMKRLDKAGADVIELGVPFSDPLADGPVIQRATERALAAGATLSGVLGMLKALRPSISAPVVIFSYANPILRMGLDAFVQITQFMERGMAAGVLRRAEPSAVAAQWWTALHGFVMLELSKFIDVVEDAEHTVLWPLVGHPGSWGVLASEASSGSPSSMTPIPLARASPAEGRRPRSKSFRISSVIRSRGSSRRSPRRIGRAHV